MIVQVKLFAAARELAGCTEVAVEVGDDATIAEVQHELVAKLPELRAIVTHARWALDAEFAAQTAKVTTDNEIALIPPVSGG